MDKQKPLGPVMTIIGADPKKRIVIIQYSTPIDRMEFTPEQALAAAEALRSRALIAKGEFPEGRMQS